MPHGQGKFFQIHSRLVPHHVLDIKGAKAKPGTHVIMWDNGRQDNQIWYYDNVNSVIRSKMCDELVLTLKHDHAKVEHFRPGDQDQVLEISGGTIRKRSNPGKVLDLANNCHDRGAKVCCWDYNGGNNQHWDLQHVEPKMFFIRSGLNGKVLDIEGGSPHIGAGVIMWDKKHGGDNRNQLWWEDMYGVIHSALNDGILDASSGKLHTGHDSQGHHGGHGHYGGHGHGHHGGHHGGHGGGDPGRWMRSGHCIANLNNPSQVLDILNQDSSCGAKIGCWSHNGGKNQTWHFDYVN